jgi:ATP-dependent RNA helicase MSS116
MKLLRAFLLLGVVNCVDAWLPNVVPRYSSSARRHHVILVASREPDEVEFNDASWRPGRPPGRRPIRARRSITSQQDDASTDGLSDEETSTTPVLTPHEQALQDPTLLSSVNVTSMIRSPLLLRSLREMGIQQLTQVQQQTIVPISEGKSVCARSKTGSGKTLAFLLPVLDQLLASKLSPKDNKSAVLIVVPTRELAKQIVDQIQALLVHQPEGDALAVTCLHGGTTSLAVDRRRLVQRWPNILVATPGRLLDHIESKSRLQGGGTFSDMIKTTKVVVLDEADRLLLEGFQKETKRILAALPRGEKRQTLMFSATVPEKMKEMIQGMLPAGSLLQVDCAEGQDRIEKRFLRLPSMDRYSSTLIAVVQQEITEDPERHKLLVFFPTARLVRFFASMFNDALGMDVVEIHSRMSQGGRTKAWTAFASAKSAVMFTSDVSARGKCRAACARITVGMRI